MTGPPTTSTPATMLGNPTSSAGLSSAATATPIPPVLPPGSCPRPGTPRPPAQKLMKASLEPLTRGVPDGDAQGPIGVPSDRPDLHRVAEARHHLIAWPQPLYVDLLRDAEEPNPRSGLARSVGPARPPGTRTEPLGCQRGPARYRRDAGRSTRAPRSSARWWDSGRRCRSRRSPHRQHSPRRGHAPALEPGSRVARPGAHESAPVNRSWVQAATVPSAVTAAARAPLLPRSTPMTTAIGSVSRRGPDRRATIWRDPSLRKHRSSHIAP